MSMSKPIHILIVEDSEDDSVLLLHELRRGGYDPGSKRVDTPGAMRTALEQQHWDLVISDYVLPGFSGLEALSVLKESGLDLPFIIVSGKIGEDIAVGAMKAGAHDYIIKGNLKRLVPAVERELRDAEVRREHRRAETLLDQSRQKLRRNYDALRESEARYRNLVEDVRDIIFTIKPDGTIASFSPAFESITGWPRDGWIGKNISDLIHPDDVTYTMAVLRDVLRGKPVPLFELRARTRSGEYRHLEFKITHGRSETAMIPGIARDVTERNRAEDDHARLVSAVESAADAVVITDPYTGVIQYVNSAFEKITGYTKEETLGRTLHILQSGKHDAEYYAGLRETLARDGVWSGKLINKKKDGTLYFEECTVSPVRSRGGDIINYVYLKRDVTEKRRLESIAESVNTMNNIGYVFSGISHEIGNPVSSLLANLEVMKEKLDGPKETLVQYVDRAMSQVSKIEYLLNSLRNFNMFEVQELQNVSVASFIDQFVSLVTEDFSKRGIAIEVVHDPAAERGRIDTRALQQVMLNIFTNAADALENCTCPKITVRTSRSTGLIRIQIEDNGCGMTVEQQEKLFKPFHTNKLHGTGLGMVIIKNMLSKMGGTIEVESVKDVRTSVDITIPEGGHGRQ